MKKIFFLSLSILYFIGFTSCNDSNNDSPALGANVKVHVQNELGANKSGVTVYMFENEVDINTKRSEAKKQVVTDSNGIADFDLTFTELNIIESQTTLYFGVFYTLGNEEIPAGSEGVTVERNKSYNVTITIPL